MTTNNVQLTLTDEEESSVCELIEKFSIHRSCATRIVLGGGYKTHRLSDEVVLLLRSGRLPSLWREADLNKLVEIRKKVTLMLDENGYPSELKIKNKLIGQKNLKEF